jgi:hypothetical protein
MNTGARRSDTAYDIDGAETTQPIADDAAAGLAADALPWIEPEDGPVHRDSIWPIVLLVLVGLAWTAAAAAGTAMALIGRVPTLPVLVSWISVGCGPIALLGIAYLLFRRTPRREARRFGAAVGTIQDEAARLEAVLARINERIESQNNAIAQQADALSALGDRAGGRLDAIGTQLRDGTDMLTRQATVLDETAERARLDIGVLLADLPEAEARALALTNAIRVADTEAKAGSARLDTALTALAARSLEAGQAGAVGAEQLAGTLRRIDELGRISEERVTTTTARISEAIEFTLREAAEAFEHTRHGIGEQSNAMLAMVDQSHVALGRAGADAAARLAVRIGEVAAQIDELGDRLAVHDEQNGVVFARLARHLADLETRYIVLGDSGLAKTGSLDTALARLRGEIEQLSNAMAAGDLATSVTLKRAEALRDQLEACVDGIDIRLPDALERIEARAVQSHRVVDEAMPKVQALLATADAAAERLKQADIFAGRQAQTMDGFLARLEGSVEAARGNAESLAGAIAEIEGRTKDLSEGAASRLVETMLRVRETAMQAAQRAEEAIAAIVPKAAATLGTASREAIEGAIQSEIEGKLDRIGAAGAQAVHVVEQSNAALLRQMAAMLETTNAIESRLEESRKRLAKSDGDSFGRRMALLIEALKSTAIDVTKMLSSDVSDATWAAYLKGDRGVFTRRAVRLVDGGEARDVARLYQEDEAFRGQVNHYIHDFEAMLRDVLANRDGSPMGVTLLSSDAGKLYVVLAQAIERLRG